MTNHQQYNDTQSANEQNFVECFAEMIIKGINADFIKRAEEFGELLVKENLSTSQIRRIFGHVKKIENYKHPKKFIPPLLMLKPILAYTEKKEYDKKSKKSPVKPLSNVLNKGIDLISSEKDENEQIIKFHRFCAGFEAILAYHKANGGN